MGPQQDAPTRTLDAAGFEKLDSTTVTPDGADMDGLATSFKSVSRSATWGLPNLSAPERKELGDKKPNAPNPNYEFVDASSSDDARDVNDYNYPDFSKLEPATMQPRAPKHYDLDPDPDPTDVFFLPTAATERLFDLYCAYKQLEEGGTVLRPHQSSFIALIDQLKPATVPYGTEKHPADSCFAWTVSKEQHSKIVGFCRILLEVMKGEDGKKLSFVHPTPEISKDARLYRAIDALDALQDVRDVPNLKVSEDIPAGVPWKGLSREDHTDFVLINARGFALEGKEQEMLSHKSDHISLRSLNETLDHQHRSRGSSQYQQPHLDTPESSTHCESSSAQAPPGTKTDPRRYFVCINGCQITRPISCLAPGTLDTCALCAGIPDESFNLWRHYCLGCETDFPVYEFMEKSRCFDDDKCRKCHGLELVGDKWGT